MRAVGDGHGAVLGAQLVGPVREQLAVEREGAGDRERALIGVTAIAAGTFHSCALSVGGTVQCWGLNISGQLGNGSLVELEGPGAGERLIGVTAIAAGARHTCALMVGGTVQCWGQNTYGQLGNRSLVSSTRARSPVSGLSGVTAIAAGTYHSCALLVGGHGEVLGPELLGPAREPVAREREGPGAR